MKFVLNIDFYDMLLTYGPKKARFVGCPDGYYPEQDLVDLIHRAAESGFQVINFRIAVTGRVACQSRVKELADNIPEWAETFKRYNPYETAVRAAHEVGIECYAWVTPLDDSGPMEGPNAGAHQSKFSREHPEFQLLSRDGDDPLFGVYCFGHPEVRDYFLAHVEELLEYEPDGIFFSNRTHSNMNTRQLEYGFNEPAIARYKELYGADPREAGAWDLEKFSQVHGGFYTQFLREAAGKIHAKGARCMAGVSWQSSGRIANRLSALHKSFFDWPVWLDEAIVDELVIGGDMATGLDPEHILPNYEIGADSVNPAHFRASPTTADIYRWMTIFSWGWEGEAERTGGPLDTFTIPTVRNMIDKTRNSLDGALIHEAANIAINDQWDEYKRLIAECG